MDYSSIQSLPSLSPGMTSPSVKTLQTWLIQNGFSIPDGATGYYGPETKAAVASWQRQAGFDTQGNPGYFGPLSKSYIQQQQTAAAATPKTATTPTSTTQPAQTGVPYDPAWTKYGVTQDQWNQMNSIQRATTATAMGAAQSMYSSSGSKVTLDDALKIAATDPTIKSKYADVFAIDQEVFTKNLQTLQQQASITSRNQQIQFENERKQLAEQEAAAGRAYSGFRGEAQKQLADTESGIVTSSRAQYQQQLDQARQNFEAKYGTSMTPNTSLTFTNPFNTSGTSISGLMETPNTTTETISSTPTGGITGSNMIAKQQDINSLASSYVTLGETPKVVQP